MNKFGQIWAELCSESLGDFVLWIVCVIGNANYVKDELSGNLNELCKTPSSTSRRAGSSKEDQSRRSVDALFPLNEHLRQPARLWNSDAPAAKESQIIDLLESANF